MAINKVDKLINKIERRLGTRQLLLPDHLTKDKWLDATIIPDSIETFSRYFPHMVRIQIKCSPDNMKDGYYLIDTDLLGGVELIGVKDIAWEVYGNSALAQQSGIGMYDYLSAYSNYSMDDGMALQARADLTSFFNNSIFVDFKEPNKIRLTTVTGNLITEGLDYIPLDVYVYHPSNLSTIPQTQMEIFEKLAMCDVANYLYGELQYYDNLETVFASVDYKLDRLERVAGEREDIVRYLDENHVNPANKNQPIMYCI